MFKIDIFVPAGRDFDRAAADRARLMTIGDDGMLELPVASPEDTVLAKLDWYRRGGETSERQWWDLVGILKVTRDADRDYLRRWATSLGVEDLLERALQDADD